MVEGGINGERREVGGREKKGNNGEGRGERRGREGKGGRRGRGEKVAPATPSSSVLFQKALLLFYLVVALSRKTATIKWGPLAVAVL